jgi:hypothetical protein
VSITLVWRNVVVKTKNACFLPKIIEYVVGKPTSVTEGYAQRGAARKKLTVLQAPVLLGLREA